MTSARGPLGVIEASGACPHYVRFTPKADIVQHDRDVRFVPKADIEIINYRNGLLDACHLLRFVEDYSNGVTHSGTKATHAVPEVDAIRALRPFYGPIMHGERNRITLP